MALIKCFECGKRISSEAVACPHCGIPSVVKKCPSCGEAIHDVLARWCKHCGTTVVSDGQLKSLKDSKLTGKIIGISFLLLSLMAYISNKNFYDSLFAGHASSAAADLSAKDAPVPINSLAEYQDFIRIARKCVSSLEAGVNYIQYSNLVLELKVAADAAIARLEVGSDIRAKIIVFSDYLVDARSFWDAYSPNVGSVRFGTNGRFPSALTEYTHLQPLLIKYPFLVEEVPYGEVENNSYYGQVHWFSFEKARDILWEKAVKVIADLK